MSFAPFRAVGSPRRLSAFLGVFVAALGGCGPTSPLERAGVGFASPEGWSSVPAGDVVVPGTALGAWSGPGGGSIVLVRSLPVPRPDARGLATELVNRWENLPGVRIVSAAEVTVAGLPAARVELVGLGNGDTLAPSGTGTPVAQPGEALVPTHRTVISILREADTITLMGQYPESARETIRPQFEAAARSLVLDDRSIPNSSY